MEKMDNSTIVKDEENLSIIERIVQKTGNPKIAAVLALDLFLVGVDTVWFYTFALVCGPCGRPTCWVVVVFDQIN